jgi:hypothetical protein
MEKKLNALCEDFFTREKMANLGVNRVAMARARRLFEEYKTPMGRIVAGPFEGASVRKLIEHKDAWSNLKRIDGVGDSTIGAINLVLRDEGLPEIVPPVRYSDTQSMDLNDLVRKITENPKADFKPCAIYNKKTHMLALLNENKPFYNDSPPEDGIQVLRSCENGDITGVLIPNWDQWVKNF